MKMLLRTLALVFLLNTALPAQPAVRTGIEVLRDRNFDILRGKRVGLITNPTGVDSRLRSTIDILVHAQDVRLVALFGPEHGVRGDFPAGARVGSSTDEGTGLPVYSLYGKNRKPAPEMLKNIDVLVYDIQDIGCRAYTFVSTLGLAMEAAAEHDIEFVVLDRPDPLGGVRVEGNNVDPAFVSFVSPYPIPYVYGLTCGELAGLLNGEGMLRRGLRCRLTVVPMKGWRRQMLYHETGLPWVPPSPHMPEAGSPLYSIATGALGELEVLSIGVGYTLPFHMFAASWISPEKLAGAMNALGLTGVLFRPVSFRPFYGSQAGKLMAGVQLYIEQPDSVNLLSLQFLLMQVLHTLYPNVDLFSLADSTRLAAFDRVLGTDAVRKAFARRLQYGDVQQFLEKDVPRFKQLSRRYLLY